jgi:hypothetical protein
LLARDVTIQFDNRRLKVGRGNTACWREHNVFRVM